MDGFLVDTKRQPGSSIKPLSVYSPAIEMGLITPATVVDDSPQELNGLVNWPPRGKVANAAAISKVDTPLVRPPMARGLSTTAPRSSTASPGLSTSRPPTGG